MSAPISFLDYSPSLAQQFGEINKQWINDMFVLEDIDAKVLNDPQTHIIDKGGKIWFVEHQNLGIIGTCALLNKGNGNYELTKMGVLKNVRGLKVGESLLKHVINAVCPLNINNLFLLTNAKCEAAIHLYKKNGFIHCEQIMKEFGQSYERCNVAMRFVGTKYP